MEDGYEVAEDRLDGWCEGGLWQHRNGGGGCASMCKRSERVEGPNTYVTESVLRGHFCLAPCSFGTFLLGPLLWWVSPGEGWDAVT